MKSPRTDGDRQFASTLASGLRLLLCFGPGRYALGNGDLVAATGLDKATVSRLTFTLVELGYLRHDAAARKYRLGARVLSLGYPMLASMHVRHVARPMMKQLADRCGGTVAMAIRDRTSMVYVDSARAESAPAPEADIGTSLPLAASTIGRAWLARAPVGERTRALNALKATQPDVHAAQKAVIEQAIADTRVHGFCTGRGLFDPRRHVAAVALSRAVDAEIIAFNCSVAPSRGIAAALRKDIGPRLVSLARTVEISLGLPWEAAGG